MMPGSMSNDLVRVVLTVIALYITTFALVRIAGRRTLSQLSAFDALITVALGSVFAASALATPPSYARGAAAVVTLLTLQVVVGSLRQRIPQLQRLLDFEPRVVYRDGSPDLSRSPLGAQITAPELEAAVRRAGRHDFSDVAVIVLEPDGGLSVLGRNGDDESTQP